MFIPFIVMVCQYLYMLFLYNQLSYSRSIYHYKIAKPTNDPSDPTIKIHRPYEYATIYKARPHNNSSKVIVIISGSYIPCFDVYIKKFIFDLEVHHPQILNDYQIIVFERLDKASLIIHKDIAKYIKQLHDEITIEELIILGFSAGGVVASKIMSLLKGEFFQQKIITYDTPWHIMDNVSGFQKNWIYRIDIMFFWIVMNTYYNHYNYEQIKHHLHYNSLFHGADKMIKMIQAIHGYSDKQMHRNCGFCLDLTEDIKIINIYCKYDPFINRETHQKYIADQLTDPAIEKMMKNNVINIEKNTTGHCSDMSFNSRYLEEIIAAIEL